MRRIVPLIVLATAVLMSSPAAAVCGPAWWLYPPTSTYRDAPLRLHFYPYESSNCLDSLYKLNGQTISVTLEGETDPTIFKVKNVVNGEEFIQDLIPVNGWEGRTIVRLPLTQINYECYPTDWHQHDVLEFSILNSAAPVSSPVKAAVTGVGSYSIGVDVEPADPQFIYWATMTPTKYVGEMPVMISPDSSSGKKVLLHAVINHHGYERCEEVFELKLCTEYSITIASEDLLGRRSTVSDPISVTIGVSPDGGYWKLGDPLNCEGYDAGVDVDSGWDAGWSDSGSVDASLDGSTPVDASASDAGSGGGGGGTGCSCSSVGL